MKERTKNCFKKLADLTNSACARCPSMAAAEGDEEIPGEFRCCDKLFCSLVESGLKKVGLEFPKGNVGGIPYMGEKGCSVPPEYRPYCTGFVCTPHFQDREFRREYDHLINKISQDPGAPKMPILMKGLMQKRREESD